MIKFIEFNGNKYCLDEKSGYYRCNKTQERLHRAIYKYYMGDIPEGYEIHHVDLDKSNNDISNLIAIPSSKHKQLHSEALTEEQRQFRRDNINNNARPKAIEWHKSKEGREWHKLHYEQMKDSFHQKKTEHVCEICGKKFFALPKAKFCSNNCKSKHRRELGLDKITKICAVCGKEFKTSKFKPASTCSQSCNNRWRKINENKENN